MISPALMAAIISAAQNNQGRPAPMHKLAGQPQPSPGVMSAVFPDRMMNQASAMRNRAYDAYGNAISAAPPKPTNPIGLGDAATLGIAGLIGKLLFRATDDDLAQFGGGYIGAKQQAANQTDEYNMRRYQAGQQRAQLDFQRQTNEAEGLEKQATYARGRADQLADKKAQRKWEEEQARAKAADEWKKQQELTKRAMIRDPKVVEYWKSQAKTPDGRAQLAEAVRGKDPEAIEAARQLSESEKLDAAKTQTENEMRPGKVEAQKLKNDWQKITNEFLPETLKGKIALTESQKKYLDTRNSYYPQYLQLALQKLHIAQTLAQNSIGNTDFDNQVKRWELETRPATDGLEAELKGQLSRQSKLTAEISKLTEEGDVDGANAKAQELSRVTGRIQQIKDRLQAIGESAPTWGGGQIGEAGPGYAPFGKKAGLPPVEDPATGRPLGEDKMPKPKSATTTTTSAKSPTKKTTTQKVGDKLRGTGKFDFGGKKK